jgi:hypothetical protein
MEEYIDGFVYSQLTHCFDLDFLNHPLFNTTANSRNRRSITVDPSLLDRLLLLKHQF